MHICITSQRMVQLFIFHIEFLFGGFVDVTPILYVHCILSIDQESEDMLRNIVLCIF